MDHGKELRESNVIVFGASRGIGLNITAHLLENGAKVTLSSGRRDNLDLALQRLADSALSASAGIVADLNDYYGLDNALTPFQASGEQYDALILSSAVLGPSGDFAKTDFADWVNTFNVNVFGSAKVIHYFLKHNLIKKNGRIIILSGGISGPDPYFISFSATKHALNGFAYSLAHQLAEKKIWVNSILPGSYHTRMNEARIERGPENIGYDNYQLALSRIAEDDTAKYQKLYDLVDFLCSSAADGIYGRLISAQYDDWQNHVEQLKNPQDELYKMIRKKD